MNIGAIKQVGSGKTSTISFTKDQQVAYNEIISWLNEDYADNDFKRALVGPAGTGKTYLVKAIITNCGYSHSTIGLAAPTHKACRVLNESINLSTVKVNTLQSDLGLRLNYEGDNFSIDNPPFDPRGKIKINGYKFYIVDESSMINRSLMMLLEKHIKANKVKLLYIGDASQLAPVRETYSAAFRGIKTYKLTQIVRQGDDNPISDLLKLLRYDIEHKSFTFLQYIERNRSRYNEDNTKGYCVLSPSEFNSAVYTNFSDSQLTTNIDFTKVVAYTNNCVSNWNKYIRNAIIENADKAVLTKNDLIISYTTIVDDFNECIIKNSEEYIINDIVNYVHPRYKLKGFLVKFTAIHGGKTTKPLFIIDHKDTFTMQMYIKLSDDFINAAKQGNVRNRSALWKEYYEFKESCLLLINVVNREGKILYSRNLDYGFALTAHKSQGSTFDTTLVDVNDIVFDKNGKIYTNAEEINRRLYVACSRCKNKLYLKYGK